MKYFMSTEPIIETFRQLSSAEKLRLVQRLWDEVEADLDGLPLTEAQRSLLDERINQHEATPSDVEPWTEARDDILRKI